MSARLGWMGGLSLNADTADAVERGGWRVSDKMLTLLMLGSGGMGKSSLKHKSK